jgi:hypothetical protein
MRLMIDCKREDKSMQPGDKRESLRQRIRPVYLSDTSGIYQRLLMKKVVKHATYSKNTLVSFHPCQGSGGI